MAHKRKRRNGRIPLQDLQEMAAAAYLFQTFTSGPVPLTDEDVIGSARYFLEAGNLGRCADCSTEGPILMIATDKAFGLVWIADGVGRLLCRKCHKRTWQAGEIAVHLIPREELRTGAHYTLEP